MKAKRPRLTDGPGSQGPVLRLDKIEPLLNPLDTPVEAHDCIALGGGYLKKPCVTAREFVHLQLHLSDVRPNSAKVLKDKIVSVVGHAKLCPSPNP